MNSYILANNIGTVVINADSPADAMKMLEGKDQHGALSSTAQEGDFKLIPKSEGVVIYYAAG